MRDAIMKTAVILAILLLATGCPQGTLLSDNADLQSLSVAGFPLDTAFDPDVTEYVVLVPAGTASAAISASAADPLACLEISSPDPLAIPLAVGPNVITAKVTAEDTSVTRQYKVTIYRCNATAQVLDSVNGSLLPATGIFYKVYDGSSLVAKFTATANPQYIYIAPDKDYRVVAEVAGRASDAREAVRVTQGAENKLSFFCQKSGMSTFPADAPTFGSFDFTMDVDPTDPDATWFPIVSGSGLNLNGITGFRVVVAGSSELDPTSWSGDGISIGIDYVPSFFMGRMATVSSSTYDEPSATFTATAIFEYAGASLTEGSHRVTIVVYDRAFNRLEKSYDIRITSPVAPGNDISAAFYQNLSAAFTTYGLSREYFGAGKNDLAMPVSPTGGTSYRAAISFKLMTAASEGSAVPILGFLVKRSTDGTVYTDIGSMNYGGLSTGNAGTHTFYDTDPDISVGTTYHYIVTAFTDGIHTKESQVMTATILPPFTASLSGPAHGSPVDALESPPAFIFSISDPSLMSPALSDRFYFAPLVRRKEGAIEFYGEFIYLPAIDDIYFRYGSNYYSMPGSFGGETSDYIAISGGTVTLKPDLFQPDANMYSYSGILYSSGVTYEWDIFGNFTGAGNLGSSSGMNPMYFYKTGSNSNSRSYADIYQRGNQTLNGWFEFTVE